jgi:hypothetical protein
MYVLYCDVCVGQGVPLQAGEVGQGGRARPS